MLVTSSSKARRDVLMLWCGVVGGCCRGSLEVVEIGSESRGGFRG